VKRIIQMWIVIVIAFFVLMPVNAFLHPGQSVWGLMPASMSPTVWWERVRSVSVDDPILAIQFLLLPVAVAVTGAWLVVRLVNRTVRPRTFRQPP
jgi:hypothetical protein